MIAIEDYITATEATKLLGISQNKMAGMLRDGVLVWIPDPFNKRAKLIKRVDVEELLAKAPRKPRSRRKQEQKIEMPAALGAAGQLAGTAQIAA